MIGSALSYLKQKLSEGIGAGNGNPKLVFLSQQDDDAIKFPKDAITMLLINMEKEEHTQFDNPYLQNKNSDFYKVYPEIKINLFLLFVANWGDYKTGLDRLSEVITFFQANRVFLEEKNLGFPEGVDKLTVEFITLPFAQQNEVWSALRTTYRPSILFKIRMLTFRQSTVGKVPVTKIKEGEAKIRVYQDEVKLQILKERKFDEKDRKDPKHEEIIVDASKNK